MSKAKIIVVLISLIFCTRLAAQDVSASDAVNTSCHYEKGEIIRTKSILDLNSHVSMKKNNEYRYAVVPSRIIIVTYHKVINVFENGDAEIYSKMETSKSDPNGFIQVKPAKQIFPLIIVKSKSGVTKSITRMKNGSLDRSTGELIYSNDSIDNDSSNSLDKMVKLGESWTEEDANSFGGGNMRCVCKLIQKDVEYGNYRILIVEETDTGDVDSSFFITRDGNDGIDNAQSDKIGTFKMQGTDKINMKDGKLISSCGLITMRYKLKSQELAESDLSSAEFLVDGTYETCMLPVSNMPAPKKK